MDFLEILNYLERQVSNQRRHLSTNFGGTKIFIERHWKFLNAHQLHLPINYWLNRADSIARRRAGGAVPPGAGGKEPGSTEKPTQNLLISMALKLVAMTTGESIFRQVIAS